MIHRDTYTAVDAHGVVGLWAYPWDIARAGIANTVERLVRARVSELSVATLYHSGQVLSLVGSPRFIGQTEGPLWDFRQPVWHDGDLRIEPEAFYAALKEALSREDIRLRGWTIVNHDSPEGPFVENAFGQHLSHAACPIAGQARIRRLIAELAAMGIFDGLDLESFGFTKAFHGAHHEIAGVRITPLLQLLLSWCFCSACNSTIGAGIDWDLLRQETQEEIERLLCHEGTGPDDMGELATYLVDHPGFAELIRIRGQALRTSLDDLARAFPTLPMTPLLMPYNQRTKLSWIEGMTADSQQRGDVIALGYSTLAAMRNDLNWLVTERGWDPSRVIVGQSLIANVVSSWDEAKARVEVALDLGFRRFCFYNYGLLNTTRWQWLENLSSIIRN